MDSIKYPIGIQNFEYLRSEGYTYIDKTELIYQLVSTGKYYFLSRPRRFGKSLLLSTIEAYFKGKKELFEGLAISQKEKEWKHYPVLHLDMNNGDYQTTDGVVSFLRTELSKWEKIYGSNPTEEGLGERFAGIIGRAYEFTGRRVVVLIDENGQNVSKSDPRR